MTKHRKIVALILALALLVSLVGCRRETFVTQAVTKFTGLFVDNRTDQVALTVQGHSTQTSNLFVLEQSDGTDVLTVSNAGVIAGSGAVTIADTLTLSKGSGNALLISAGGTITLPATSDISAYGYVNVGDGTPDGSVTAGTDEQLYVEGAFEVDGEAEFDGAIDADSTSNFADTATFSKGSGVALSVSAGGELNNDGTLDQNGTSDFADTVTLSKGSGNALLISAGGTITLPATSDISAYGYVNVGDGTPDGSVTAGTDEQLYVEGAFEVDGTAEFDGNAEFDGTVDMDSTLDVAGIITVQNNESMDNSTDATFDFTRNDSGTVIITASDDDATAALTIDSGGAADLTLGSADATGVDLVANGNMDITIGGATDYIFKANEFEVQAGSVINHSSGTNEGVVWICEKAVSHTDVETTVTMCVIPANANIVDVTFTVETQWNDGVSAVIDCGINAGDVDAYVDNHNINDAADVNRTGDNADMPFLTALGDVGGSAITVDCTIDEGNVDANAGAATLRIFYFLD